MGENGGVGAGKRGVAVGVLWLDISADFGVSTFSDLALLGADVGTAGLRPRIVRGGAVSDGVIASTQGLLELSSAIRFPLLLSLLLSRMLFVSPFTAGCLVKPEDVDAVIDSGHVVLELTTLVVSITSPLLGEFALTSSGK